ncbi:MAG: hypothetical protein M1352_01880 [Patescibacteria group bacterium]|nr:hypothetical protein [Patescibacteria group bacterium]
MSGSPLVCPKCGCVIATAGQTCFSAGSDLTSMMKGEGVSGVLGTSGNEDKHPIAA